MPIQKRWTRFTRENIEKLDSSRGTYEIADRAKEIIYIGGSDSAGGVRGRLISHLINKKFPTAEYFRCVRVHDGIFSLSGIRLESEQAQKFREKHSKKPSCMKRAPKWD